MRPDEASALDAETLCAPAPHVLPPHLCKLAVPVRGGHPAVHQDVAAGDEAPVGAHEERTHGGYLVGSAGTAHRGRLDHAPVPLTTRTGELVLGQRGDDDARADGVDPRTALPQRTASAITRSELPRFESWYA